MNNSVTHEYIHQSNLIEGINSPDEDAQGERAWEYLKDQTEITNRVICMVQRIITKLDDNLEPSEKGYYRDHTRQNVYVGSYAAPHWSMVQGLMDNWVLDAPEQAPLEAHIRFERIHPFVDGNGRTGRMLMWWQQIQKLETPTLYLAENRQTEYYPLFNRK